MPSPTSSQKSTDDAYRALGFVHARDRLFQMDFMRRLGAGRLSEVTGRPTLRLDKTMRTLGLYRLEEETVKRLPPDARAALDAYSQGVNAFLSARSGALPPEFIVLRYRPEEWTPADSLVWGRLMAMRLTGNWRTEALRAALSARLNAAQISDGLRVTARIPERGTGGRQVAVIEPGNPASGPPRPKPAARRRALGHGRPRAARRQALRPVPQGPSGDPARRRPRHRHPGLRGELRR